MRLGSLSHLASDLLGLKNRPFERVVHAHSHFPAAKGEYEVPRLAHAHETGFFKPIIWHIRTTFRRKDITSFSMPHVSNFTSISNRVSYGRVRR